MVSSQVGPNTQARCLYAIALWTALFVTESHAGELSPPLQTRTSIERMELEHLKAAHEDAERWNKTRRKLPPHPNLTDFRAILHAHAEDSTHTGGTRSEMLTDAKRAGVQAILLTDHHRPPKDFISDSWQGIHDGVLFIPGSEARGFLLYPTHSIMHRMADPTPSLIQSVRQDRGLIFLSHIEERPDHSMEGLDGLEIYNRHADAKKDAAGILAVLLKMTDPASLKELEDGLRMYPDEMLAFQCGYPDDYLAKWDAETTTRRLTGVAANDCHHNQVLIMKMVDANTAMIGTNVDADAKFRSFTATLRPGIRLLTKDRQPGDELARLDFDPYFRSFRNVSTHILASELSESTIRMALRDGHAYVSHDWMCDPTGFSFQLHKESGASDGESQPESVWIMGDECAYGKELTLFAEFPVECRIRLLNSGKLVTDQRGLRLQQTVSDPGVYRVEAWLAIDGEDRPWIYSNPIYIRGSDVN